MKVKLVRYTPMPAELCGEAASCCWKKNNHEKSLKHAMESGHLSVLEHASFTFYIEDVSRVLLAQLTRHRIASFTVESQRYVRIDGCTLIVPESIQKMENAELREKALRNMAEAMQIYSELADSGVPAEDARYITPQAVPTSLYLSMNARELMHFFELRTCNRAQWEIREMADEMLKICRKIAPKIFLSAGPGCVTGGCPEMRPCGHPRNTDEWK